MLTCPPNKPSLEEPKFSGRRQEKKEKRGGKI